ncbi:MAG: MarR family winged helix-turn-helix transcriptional regulator [Acidimicrobiales bacterium]
MHGHGPHPDIFSGVFMLARELRRQVGELMASEQWAIDAGFRPPCVGVIAVVAHRQPISQREISDALGLDASDVVGVMDILESAGLVERRRDPHDRRRHAVVLTQAGEAAARRFAELRVEVEERVFAVLDPEERRQLADLLGRVCEKASFHPA